MTHKQERNSNIELLRIIAMMGVIALHYVHADIGGVEKYIDTSEFTWFFVSGVRSLAIPLVNVFVLISGYFMITSTLFSIRKPLNLIMITFFYGSLFFLLNGLSGASEFILGNFIQGAFPYLFGSAWFIRTYLALLLIAPFINKALAALSIKTYRILLTVQLLLFSVLYSIGFTAPIADDGYGILNFITLYMLGGYIRRFSGECRVITAIKRQVCLLGYVICVLLTGICSYFLNPFGYCFITNIAGAVFLFLFVEKCVPRQVKPINILSSKAFDAYFIHTYVFRFMQIEAVATTYWVMPHILLTVLICYLVSFVVGTVRDWIFKYSIDVLFNRIRWINKKIPV